MIKTKECLMICLVGAVGYSLIEIIWRGYTHWTMSITGGVGFLLLCYVDMRMGERALILRAFTGCIVITLIELIAGCLINLVFHMGVWDYSGHAGNLLGQICPLYCALWFFLCLSVMPLGRFFHRIITISG